jgi:peptidyl-prolyl cis-trans isomerase SurA
MRRAAWRPLAFIVGGLSAAPLAPFLLAGTGLAAQESRTLDRIVAIVGTRPIVASQIEEQLTQLQAQGTPVPQDSAGRAAMRVQLVQEMVEDELLVQQAERDTTIHVTDQEVLDQVEQTVQNVRKQFATEAEFQGQMRVAGFLSIDEWRRRLSDQQRRVILRQRLVETLRQQGKLRPIPPTDAQMREYWERNKGQLPRRPAVVSFRQIVIAARPDSGARARARQVAESLVVELRRGADFAVAARRFSGDSASREQGGDLGWFRRGSMVSEFDAVAFRQRPGEISEPVETDFGFHIIRVDRVQPGEVSARHILIQPVISPERIEAARLLADSARAALVAGGSFDSLARRHAAPAEERLAEDVPVANLPPEYQEQLAGDTTTGVRPVFVLSAAGGRPKFIVLEVRGSKPEGDLTYEDVKLRIRERLSQDLAIQHYLTQLRRQTYVDVRL